MPPRQHDDGDPYADGMLQYTLEAFDSAIPYFTKAIDSALAINPDFRSSSADSKLALAYYQRAKCYEAEGRYRDTMRDIREYITLKPEDYKGYVLAAGIWIKAGKWRKAAEKIDMACLRVGDDSEAEEAINNAFDALQDARARAEASPIHSLPAELLILTLSFALDAHDTPLPPPSAAAAAPLSVNPVVAASLVCRRWHSAICDATTLWTSLRIDGKRYGTKAAQRAEWWAGRAFGRARLSGDVQEGSRRGAGITSLTLTSLDFISDGTLRLILSQLDPADGLGPPPSLTAFACSWTSTTEQGQITTIIKHLVSTSSTTLASFSLHTPSHLQIHLSLPRLCNTFVALSTLSLRSASAKTQAPTVWILPKLLPPYDGEDDWPPTALRRLTLVGPTWRLKFRDGTIASPELTREDCPKLEELELGPTSPPMTWDLLSAKGLKRLSISDTFDSPQESDPDFTSSSSTLTDLRISNSPYLVRRLFFSPSIDANGISFPHLVSADLRGAHLTGSGTLLSYLSTNSAPNLTSLSLAQTTYMASEPLEMPLMAGLKVLDCSGAGWVDAWSSEIKDLVILTPRLQRLNLSRTNVRGSGLLKFVEARNPLPPSAREDEGDPGLIELNLVGCRMMEDKAIKWLEGRIRRGGLSWKMGVVGTPSEERKRWRGVGEW
ncbi:hypothetical protein BCR35DRAFT_307221, partial [Leucosporidium creatinivorum]